MYFHIWYGFRYMYMGEAEGVGEQEVEAVGARKN